MEVIEDVDLIKQYLSGNQKALEDLIQRYFRQIFLFSKTYVKQDQEAEDVTQETFVKLWKNVKKFDQNKKFKTWLFQIAKNTCIDFLRKQKIRPPTSGADEEDAVTDLENVVDQNPLPEELFDSLGFSKKLDELLNSLPGLYRQVLVLHLQQDLTFQEISEVLNEPLNTVKSRYRRGLLQLRQEIT